MARQAREKSESGIYHVMLRGINKQQIFFEEQDYKRFIRILIDCKKVSKFELYAYCLMNNHIHLLIKENGEPLSLIMKRIGCRFVYWYNAKYERVGHLFQDRFRSEPIETDEYFLCALRYIHQNPVDAGLVKTCADYPFSSYNWYFENGVLVDKERILSMMNINQFKQFHLAPNETDFVDYHESRARITDEKAEEMIAAIIGNSNVNEISNMDSVKLRDHLQTMKNSGLSIRQIAKLTGVSKRIVEKA